MAATDAPIVIAQAAQPAPDQKKEEPKPGPPAAKPPAPPASKPAAPPAPPAAQRPTPPPPAAERPAPPPPAAERPRPPAPPAAERPRPPQPPAAQAPSAPPPPSAQPPQRGERPAGPPRGERPEGQRPPGAPPAAQRPAAPQPPSAQPAPPPPPAAEKPAAPPPAAQAPAAQPQSAPPSRGERPDRPRGERPDGQRPPGAQRPGSPPPPAARQPAPPPPAAQQQPPNSIAGRAAQEAGRPAAAPPPPPTQPRSAGEFIRRGDQGPQRGFDDIRRERRETRDGNRTIITEGDRTIVRDGNRTIIRHNEADRFAIGARDVRVTRRGDDAISIIVRPDGAQIITTTASDGRLLRRVRRDRSGREVVIIDNRFAGPRPGFFVDVPPPRWRGPPERYILDGRRADRDAVYTLFIAPPIQRIERRYTLDEVRYSEPLRAYMPRVDLDVHFDTGSWQISSEQIERLAVIADGINRAIQKNPREVFMIEGHTDAVGSDEDNLSLSDRRAESVAVALTEQFQVPPENLVTQGYGEQYLKVQTDGPSEENRRVAVRRITPLIDQQAAR